VSKQSKKTTNRAAHPWVIDGIDYGPAIAAAGDLAAWAFDLAAKDVADWPEGRRRVRAARRYVLARLRGKHPSSTPFEDVLFTAGLLARIFEADVGLGMVDIVAILDEFGLPTEVVPLRRRAQHGARVLVRPPLVPLHPRPAGTSALPEPCEECGELPRFRNAA